MAFDHIIRTNKWQMITLFVRINGKGRGFWYTLLMKRDLYTKLHQWKNTLHRKPLVLRGARQVGKTYLLKAFGKSEFDDMLYINFEESPQVKRIFEGDLNPVRILRDLSLYFQKEIIPSSTLLILDEIQECPNALTSLKYFQEQANDYFLVSAGSLLGIKLSKTKGFPVGKVNFLTLYPCSFFEFLTAIKQEPLRLYLEEIKEISPLSEPIHEQLIDYLKLYYFIGGMPEAVKNYVESKDLIEVRKIQKDILDAYLLDFSKHAPPQEVMKISIVWNSIPSQLTKENKKFMFSQIEQGARSREYNDPIQWLVDAGLIHRASCISVPRVPIDSYSEKKSFKIFMLDVGLLSALSELPAKAILQGDALFTEFKGALTENFVAQELKTRFENALYYWASQGQAEVDFIIPYEGEIYPLEVKAGTSTKQKSLGIYAQKFHPKMLTRTSLQNLKKDGDFFNYPLYMIGCFPI